MSPLDIYNNTIVNKRLRAIDIAFLEKIEYFCSHFQDLDSIPEELLNAIKPDNKMTRKNSKTQTQQKSATEYMINYRINNTNNNRSLNTSRTNILDFRKFLKDNNIPDTIESMTKDIAARYSEWLKKQNISINIANQRIRALATNLRNLTTILDLKFEYPLPEKLPLLKETITGDELEENDIALTEEQIEILFKLEKLTEQERVARDMFCLQCWTGVRVSDVAKVLDSSNLKEINGVIFTIFRPEKTKNNKKIKAIIPLTSIFPHVYEIVKHYKDNTPSLILSPKNDYNELIRAICRIAKFNEVKEKTTETGNGKETKTYELWELMSSHKGRHTFTTNCKKRGIPDHEIIKMTGHSSTIQIQKTYDNTNAEDNAKLLLDALSGNCNSIHSQGNHLQTNQHKGSYDPISVLRRALSLLGGTIQNTQDLNLVHLAEQIINKKAEIIKKYGIQFYQNLKETIMQGQSVEARNTLERHLCKALNRTDIKLRSNIARLSRLRW